MLKRSWFDKQVIKIILILPLIILAGCQQNANNNAASPNNASTVTVATPTEVAASEVKATPQNANVVPTDTGSSSNAPTLAPTARPTLAPITLEGAIVTVSGLQYLEEKAGDGPTPVAGDIITMNYIASLSNGSEIYNSYNTKQPAITIFGRKKLLTGWEEAVGLMKAGGKAKIAIPPALAFGDKSDPSIPPNSQIIMEIELVSIKPSPKPALVAEDKYTKTASGLKYTDIMLGTGAEVVKTNIVKTHFTIWVKNGSNNDFVVTSEGQDPLEFTVGVKDMVIPGWDEGVVGMKVGGKRLLIIPPALGFGAQPKGDIPANAEIIMEIQLVAAREPRLPEKVEESKYTTTPSGLKYFDIKEGTGNPPVRGQNVVVNYTGWLQDGTQFDSSLDRNEPFTFQLGAGNVIAGWEEGVSTMKVGTKRQLVIPAALAYGDAGAGAVIPPKATLVFEIELLMIK